MFINRLRMSKGKLFKLFDLQSTLALRTPRYYGHHPLGDKSQTPGETHITKISLRPNPDSHNIKRHYDKGKQRTHFSIGCELENFLKQIAITFKFATCALWSTVM